MSGQFSILSQRLAVSRTTANAPAEAIPNHITPSIRAKTPQMMLHQAHSSLAPLNRPLSRTNSKGNMAQVDSTKANANAPGEKNGKLKVPAKKNQRGSGGRSSSNSNGRSTGAEAAGGGGRRAAAGGDFLGPVPQTLASPQPDNPTSPPHSGPDPTGSAFAGMMTGILQLGQATALPACSSMACTAVWQSGHVATKRPCNFPGGLPAAGRGDLVNGYSPTSAAERGGFFGGLPVGRLTIVGTSQSGQTIFWPIWSSVAYIVVPHT